MDKKTLPQLAKGLPYKKETDDKLIRREGWDEASLKRLVRDMGIKVTHQRLAILQALADGRAHVTAQEVFETVFEKHPDIGFATVYRFLRKMAELNYVTEVRMGGLPARYELTPRKHHDHLTCTMCGRIVEFENKEIESLQEQVARDNGFELTHHVLELYGVCGSCQKHRDKA